MNRPSTARDTIRLVVFSDLHLEARFVWMGGSPEARRRRREALRRVLQKICDLAREREADALLCAGDLTDREQVSADTAEFLRRTFAELQPMRVFLAPGNHDWYSDNSFYARGWSPNVHVFTENQLTPVVLNDAVTLWGAAHRQPANTPGFLDGGFRVAAPGIHLALFHGAERGWLAAQERGKQPHAPFDPAQIAAAGLRHAFVGHYHNPKDDVYHTYPGNPEPLAFGETGERGAVVVTVYPDGSIERERVRVSETTVHDIEVDVTGCADRGAVRDVVAARLSGLSGVARVRLSGELEESVQIAASDLQDVPNSLDALRVELGPLTVAYDLGRISEEPTVRGEFVRDVQADRELSADDKRRILITGLRALDGRDDLEVP
ncbi:MAG TPA: metallophosphoesterase [Dehalococcoidia bacterium]|nr:metallophosphoesterase [Dehalococcoidia bacterium]